MGKGDSPQPSPGDAVQVWIAGATDVGQVRDHNEDAYLVASLGEKAVDRSSEVFRGPLPPAGLLFAVADGMGGAASGEVASRMAVDTLTDQLRDGYPPDADQEVLQRGLEGALTTANEKIFAVASQDAKHRGMGTTMTAVLASADRICFSQIGDSRAYLLRKGELVQITKDQSLIEQLIEDGTLTPEEAEKIGGKNIILQALGVEDAIRADTRHLELLSDDVVLVCSDGLSGMISDAEIQQILTAVPEPDEACRQLIDAANKGGGRDNISVIVAHFSGGGLRAPAGSAGELVVKGAPPPDTNVHPSRRKFFILLAAVGAAILLALLLLLGGSSPLVLVFNVEGVHGTLTPLDDDGEPDASRAIEFTVASDRKQHQIEDLESGEWVLEVSLDGYKTKTVGVEVTAVGSTSWVDLEVQSRAVYVTTTVPGATVELERAAEDGAPRYDKHTYEEGSPVRFYRDPGKYKLTIHAPGYVLFGDEIVVPAGGEDVRLEIPLKPNLGTLVLKGAVKGSHVKVTDLAGEVPLDGVLPESGELSLKEGEYEVLVTSPRHKPWRHTGALVVGQARAEPITVKQMLLKATLIVRIGPAKQAGVEKVDVKPVGDGEGTGLLLPDERDGEGFATLTFKLDEGEYRVHVGSEEPRKVTVEAGKAASVEFK